MKHAASRELYTYWQALRGRRPAPQRAEIEPGAIRHVLSEAFIVALDRGAGYPFRLAGTRVCALFGRELKGESFLEPLGRGEPENNSRSAAPPHQRNGGHGGRSDGAKHATASLWISSYCCCR